LDFTRVLDRMSAPAVLNVSSVAGSTSLKGPIPDVSASQPSGSVAALSGALPRRGYGDRLFTTSVRYAMCNAATSMHFLAAVALAVNTPRCAMSCRCRRLHIHSPHHDWRSGFSPVRSWKAFRTRSASKDQVTSNRSDISTRSRTLLLWSFAASISLSSTNSVAHSPAAAAMIMAIACCPADESERASESNWSQFGPNRARGVFL
jgi:hypothetical protein